MFGCMKLLRKLIRKLHFEFSTTTSSKYYLEPTRRTSFWRSNSRLGPLVLLLYGPHAFPIPRKAAIIDGICTMTRQKLVRLAPL